MSTWTGDGTISGNGIFRIIGTKTLTITIIDDHGTTDPSPGEHDYTEFSFVPIHAIPDTGYGLDHWDLDGIDQGFETPIFVEMTEDHDLDATYSLLPTAVTRYMTENEGYQGWKDADTSLTGDDSYSGTGAFGYSGEISFAWDVWLENPTPVGSRLLAEKVGQVTLTEPGVSLLSATWESHNTNIEDNQALVFIPFIRFGDSSGWIQLTENDPIWSTEILGDTKLYASTWTFYTFVEIDDSDPNGYYGRVFWGPSYETRVEGITTQ